MAKMGESQMGSVSFLLPWKRSMGNLRKVAPLSLNCFGRFSVLIPPYLFTVHVRPVLSPCQAGNTCYISSCFSNTCTIDNILNTICTHNVYMSRYLLLSRVVVKLNLWTHRRSMKTLCGCNFELIFI